jgi:hypothetical protein
MHDPFQNYQLLGAYSGGATPFGIPYAGVQNPALHPGAFTGHPLAAHLLAQGPFQNPLLQLQNPLLQNPLLQNPLQSALQNPLIGAGLQNPYQTIPQQAFGYPLAPQTMIGAGNPYGGGQQFAGQPYGGGQVGFGQPQIHPLIAQQIALRSLATAGISPWACY